MWGDVGSGPHGKFHARSPRSSGRMTKNGHAPCPTVGAKPETSSNLDCDPRSVASILITLYSQNTFPVVIGSVCRVW